MQTLEYKSLTIEPGSSFTLGSSETLNLDDGNGLLHIRPGGVLIANGTINGALVNNGLLIVPITRAGLLSRVVPGPSRGVIIIAVPVLPPGEPPVVVPLPSPPRVEPGEMIVIGGGGPGGSGGGGGGGGSGGGSSGGVVRLDTPSIAVEGTVRYDAKLEITGDFTQSDTGVARLFIAGDVRGETYSAVDSGGAIALDGELQIVLRPELFGYLPRVGDTFDVMFGAEGVTLTDGEIVVRTMMTAQGAAELGMVLPVYASPFAADPDGLVSFPSNLFTHAIVDDGRMLRLTMIAPVCPPLPVTASAVVCPSSGAAFSIAPEGSGPFTYQWQVKAPSGEWMNLQTSASALACVSGPGGAAQAWASNPTGSSTSISITPCPSAPGQLLAVQRFPVRVVVTSDCGAAATSSVDLTVCVADFNCSRAVTIDDIFVFLNAWFAADPRCDVNNVAGVSIDDIFIYLNLWFAGC